jgi:hypothetical protein
VGVVVAYLTVQALPSPIDSGNPPEGRPGAGPTSEPATA